jgi:hypothetical protein
MKRLFTILILFAVFVQMCSSFVIFLNYEINKDYIAKVLCENRNNPKKHCNGHCQLKKQLEKDEKQNQSPVNPLKEKNEVNVYFENNPDFTFTNSGTVISLPPFSESSVPNSCFLSVFRPPRA